MYIQQTPAQAVIHELLFLWLHYKQRQSFFMCTPYLYLPNSEGETTIRVNGQAGISVRLYGRNANAPSVANNRTPYSKNEGIS